MQTSTRSISKRGTLGLLDEIEAAGRGASVIVSPDTLRRRAFAHLLPTDEAARAVAVRAVELAAKSDTGVAVFVGDDRSIAIEPPAPIGADFAAAGAHTEPLRRLLASQPIIGIALLRLGRYAIGVLEGERLIASKTAARYVKSRHRAGGSSQRRFARSRERLIRELYDAACKTARRVFEPHMRDMDYVMTGGERVTLNGFAKRCRLMQDLKPRTLSRRLAVDRPNRRALDGIAYEVWKSRVTFFGGN